MELQYELTADDYRAFSQYEAGRLKSSPRPWQPRALSVALGVATGLVLLATRPSERVPTDVLIVFGFLIAFVAISSYRARLMVRAYRDAAYHDGPTAITVHLWLVPAGIQTQTSLGSGITFWHGLRDVAIGEQHIFVWEGIASVHIIPKRAFRDEQHMRAFLDEMARLKTAATGGLAPSAP